MSPAAATTTVDHDVAPVDAAGVAVVVDDRHHQMEIVIVVVPCCCCCWCCCSCHRSYWRKRQVVVLVCPYVVVSFHHYFHHLLLDLHLDLHLVALLLLLLDFHLLHRCYFYRRYLPLRLSSFLLLFVSLVGCSSFVQTMLHGYAEEVLCVPFSTNKKSTSKSTPWSLGSCHSRCYTADWRSLAKRDGRGSVNVNVKHSITIQACLTVTLKMRNLFSDF